MSRFSHDLIGRIKERVDLVEVVGSRVLLKKSGDRHWGCCPFHEEKKPSFSVKEGFYYCFGCHEHGDAISFLEKTEGLRFTDAVRNLAGRVGLEVEWETQQNQKLSDQIRSAEYQGDDALKPQPSLKQLADPGQYETMDENRFVLFSREPAKYFIEKRGLTQETCEAWHLGDDTYMQRALIPIRDSDGYLVGVTGRYYGADDKPKYLHTLGMKGGMFLFGEHMIDRSVETAILVESHLSVLKLWQFGYPNALATMGSKASQVQVKKTIAWFNRVYLLADGDGPGRNWLRLWEEALRGKLEVVSKVCPDGKDPEDSGLDWLKASVGSPPGVNKGIVTRPKGFQGVQQRMGFV